MSDLVKNVHKEEVTYHTDYENEKSRILIVDDEVSVVLGLKRVLRKNYDVEIANDAEKAWSMLRENEAYHAVIADMHMPGIDGVSFLSEVKKIYPFIMRLLLSGDKSFSTAIEAVNRAEIFRYLEKPCPVYMIEEALEEAIAELKRREALASVEALKDFANDFKKPLDYIISLAHYMAEDEESEDAMKLYARNIIENGHTLEDMTISLLKQDKKQA